MVMEMLAAETRMAGRRLINCFTAPRDRMPERGGAR
jgi:hypothetical protein